MNARLTTYRRRGGRIDRRSTHGHPAIHWKPDRHWLVIGICQLLCAAIILLLLGLTWSFG